MNQTKIPTLGERGKRARRRHTSDGEGAKGQGRCVGAVDIGPAVQQCMGPAEKSEREFGLGGGAQVAILRKIRKASLIRGYLSRNLKETRETD